MMNQIRISAWCGCVAVVERWGDERTSDWRAQGLAGDGRNEGNDTKILQIV